MANSTLYFVLQKTRYIHHGSKPIAGYEKLLQQMDYLYFHLQYMWTTGWQKIQSIQCPRVLLFNAHFHTWGGELCTMKRRPLCPVFT